MTTHRSIIGRAAPASPWLLPLLLFTVTTAASAQNTEPDPRWQAWLGCWEPADAPASVERGASDAPVLCVLPAADGSAVEMATVIDGKIVDRQRVETVEQRPSSREGCTGWESVTWSPDGRRVYRHAEHTCAGDLQRRSTGLMAILPTGEWLDVQGVSAGGYTDVRVVRYREASNLETLPAELRTARQGREQSVEAARIAAAAPLTTADIIEASRRLDSEVVEAWLVEREQGFELDARKLVELADAGVPARVIDLMVALSYPEVFAINRDLRRGKFRPDENTRRPEQRRPGPVVDLGWWDHPGWGYPGYGYGYGYSYRYGYGYAGYPIVIVPRGSGDDEASQSRARAVKGRGYTRSGGSAGTTPTSRTSDDTSRPTSSRPSTSDDSSRSGSASSGSKSSGSTRTAKPRPPEG